MSSNDALDVVGSTLSSDGVTLSWVVKLRALPDRGYADEANGLFFRLGFVWDERHYEFHLSENRAPLNAVSGANGFGFWYSADSGASRTLGQSYIFCRSCEGEIDRDTDSLRVTASVAAMAGGLEFTEQHDAVFGKGAELTGLSVLAQRHIATTLTATADVGEAPEGTVFTV